MDEGILKIFRMRKIVVLCCCCFIINSVKGQQEAHYSQYIFNGLYVNPAYAGYKGETYGQSFYRLQWLGIEGAPRSYSMAVDGVMNKSKTGLGLLLAKDILGAQNSLSVNGNYAYRIKVGEKKDSWLALGIGGGVVQSGIDGRKLNAVDNGDSYIPTGYESSAVPDARAGVLFANDTFFAGFSVDHILAKTLSKEKYLLIPVADPQYYFTGGAIFPLDECLKIKPSFLFRSSKDAAASVDLNTFILFGDRLWVGGSFRTGVSNPSGEAQDVKVKKTNALVGVVELFATGRIRIGYAFDHPLSSLADAGRGSHELSLGFYLGKKRITGSTGKCYF